jgi:hypothetical protein
MNHHGAGLICRFLAICMFLLSFQTANAGMIGAEATLAGGTVQTSSALVAAGERATLADRLQQLGVSRTAAEKRLGAMSDREVRNLAQRLDSMPAGADGGVIILAILIIAGLMVWGNMR